jgi:hypothetical protein
VLLVVTMFHIFDLLNRVGAGGGRGGICGLLGAVVRRMPAPDISIMGYSLYLSRGPLCFLLSLMLAPEDLYSRRLLNF